MTAPAADPTANKDVVQRWFALGLSTPEALDLVADDVRWHLPPSLAVLLKDDASAAEGHDGLRWVTRMSDAVYAERRPSEVDFLIADGDWVVMQMVVNSRLHTGDYRNRYCFTIRCAQGRIAEIYEHLDSLHFFRTALDPPQALSDVRARIDDSS
ncbi:nuclear transport factor 2 family protein [Blastococcus sp. CT_GayMR16]|uniref:nuclear transport factor 2 family protein n=1 Tax=Blastococcus sp. CT_GayMR16 TaxID=2559607 RepID=UPI00143167B4|nr:nuclear transport factor 2 family protein [Blastococcus sp. CT_GayMR16]